MDACLAHSDSIDPKLRDGIEAQLASDHFSRALDLRLMAVKKGRAVLRMAVTEKQLNPHGSCHGGAVWTLADMAFGAAGYYQGPMLTVGSNLAFVKAALEGTTLYATAAEVTQKGRTGTFHIAIATHPDDAVSIVAAGTFTGRWVSEVETQPEQSQSKRGQKSETE